MSKLDKIFDKLDSVVDRYNELNELISDPEVIADTPKFTKLSKEEGSIRDIVAEYKKYKDVVKQINDDDEMLHEKLDSDFESLVKDELNGLTDKKQQLEHQLKLMLIPKDPNDDKNIIMEIRGAAGGDEGSLFAADLFNMYTKYADSQGWKVEVLDENPTDVGGFKEIDIMISGKKVYSKLKYENGAHRVQRVPITESSGRLQTSTATVGVMPEQQDVNIKINPKDIKTDVYRSSGAGGQHVNKTSSAVRMTHLPTGIVVAMQDERSQQQNRAKAMQVLKSRVYNYYKQASDAKYDQERKSAIGTGDRSERIRTYNYPQNRVTDHRIGLTVNNLDKVMDGDLEGIISALIVSDQAKKLDKLTNE
ncbi:peptide chain release factor 1 [Philodulcilactobacillus myokoensis]|uniref:Peptide chain release factor 1 n=1 Tax=Philodulcilactobacillus myokoensis TaxID=2929573 RepID=A0A9W6B206_9LACO|nr:peptide chain release factor 1 [Philodulcilactobacillus myokoensis]GLB47086.1 peptide chain release factor 1 [Philodulcilactobacillus myokoensis]